MNHLILIKHAMPHIDTAKSSRDWELSPEGRQSCLPLAEAIRSYSPQHMVTSDEPKAHETGQIVADHLRVPCTTLPNLHEHDRQGVSFIPDKTKWHALIQTFFAQPDDLIFGNETANQARDRFAKALENTLTQYPGNLAVATHGTVISLFVAHKNNASAFDLWSRFDLPSFIVLNRNTFKIVNIVGKIT